MEGETTRGRNDSGRNDSGRKGKWAKRPVTHKLHKAFSKFHRLHRELVEKYNVSLRKLLHQGISEPEFYGDLVYKIRKNCGEIYFFGTIQKAY